MLKNQEKNKKLNEVFTSHLNFDDTLINISSAYTLFEILHHTFETLQVNKAKLLIVSPLGFSYQIHFSLDTPSLIGCTSNRSSITRQILNEITNKEKSDTLTQNKRTQQGWHGSNKNNNIHTQPKATQSLKVTCIISHLSGTTLNNKSILLLNYLIRNIVSEQQSLPVDNIQFDIETSNENTLQTKPKVLNGILANVDISKEHPAIARAITFIFDNFKSDISMQDLSGASYVSPSHLSSLFKERFNLSFKKVLMHIRIEEAKRVLSKHPQRQVTLICTDSGFSDLSHFEKTFKKYVGLSPSVYRKTMHTKRKTLSIKSF